MTIFIFILFTGTAIRETLSFSITRDLIKANTEHDAFKLCQMQSDLCNIIPFTKSPCQRKGDFFLKDNHLDLGLFLRSFLNQGRHERK